MYICRRIFVVLLADNDHGKSTIIRSMVSQAIGKRMELHKKGKRDMITPWGRHIDAYVFGRSYQEVEKGRHKSVSEALDKNDNAWRSRDLIVMPSHVGPNDIGDIQDMITLAHAAGFDTVAVPVIYWDKQRDNRTSLAPALALNWNMRLSVSNPWSDQPSGQLWALGNHLWSWISRTLTH